MEYRTQDQQPRLQQANDKAESAVKIAKNLLRKEGESGEDPYLSILAHRYTTPEGVHASPIQSDYWDGASKTVRRSAYEVTQTTTSRPSQGQAQLTTETNQTSPLLPQCTIRRNGRQPYQETHETAHQDLSLGDHEVAQTTRSSVTQPRSTPLTTETLRHRH